jgi:hypothetical protein
VNFYEQLVASWLTDVNGCFVLPQAKATGDKWHARPDFVAVDFRAHRVLVVEVTKDADKVKKLARQLRPEHRLRLEEAVRISLLHNCLDYEIHHFFFLRDQKAVDAWHSHPDVGQYLQAGGHARAMALEQVLSDIKMKLP